MRQATKVTGTTAKNRALEYDCEHVNTWFYNVVQIGYVSVGSINKHMFIHTATCTYFIQHLTKPTTNLLHACEAHTPCCTLPLYMQADSERLYTNFHALFRGEHKGGKLR